MINSLSHHFSTWRLLMGSPHSEWPDCPRDKHVQQGTNQARAIPGCTLPLSNEIPKALRGASTTLGAMLEESRLDTFAPTRRRRLGYGDKGNIRATHRLVDRRRQGLRRRLVARYAIVGRNLQHNEWWRKPENVAVRHCSHNKAPVTCRRGDAGAHLVLRIKSTLRLAISSLGRSDAPSRQSRAALAAAAPIGCPE